MVHLDDEHKGTQIHGTMGRWFHSPSLPHGHLFLCRQQYLPSFISSWFNKMITLKTNLQFYFVEVISSSLIHQCVTVQLDTGMEKGTGQGAVKGRWKVPCSHSLSMQSHPFDSQFQKSIPALLSYGHFKSYFSSPVVWQECYVPSFKYSYPGTPSKTFIFIMFFFWTLFTKPARITKKLRFERGRGVKWEIPFQGILVKHLETETRMEVEFPRCLNFHVLVEKNPSCLKQAPNFWEADGSNGVWRT